ncbi:MAG: metal-dependent transcriptional regulator [Defluviitaleaceae bacterium]|nr:metal-dependent transcriptional regulator [Defluviitaleaceae bacterium]
MGARVPESDKFYTFKGYAMMENSMVTASMEDYLEMIYRIHSADEAVRIGSLAESLNVKPSSATKMVGSLKEHGLVLSEKYGYITLTDLGKELGRYLVFRHDILHSFLCHINRSQNELEQVEKIEHFFNKETVLNIQKLLEKQQHPARCGSAECCCMR